MLGYGTLSGVRSTDPKWFRTVIDLVDGLGLEYLGKYSRARKTPWPRVQIQIFSIIQ
jgi:hypothetical protein